MRNTEVEGTPARCRTGRSKAGHRRGSATPEKIAGPASPCRRPVSRVDQLESPSARNLLRPPARVVCVRVVCVRVVCVPEICVCSVWLPEVSVRSVSLPEVSVRSVGRRGCPAGGPRLVGSGSDSTLRYPLGRSVPGSRRFSFASPQDSRSITSNQPVHRTICQRSTAPAGVALPWTMSRYDGSVGRIGSATTSSRLAAALQKKTRPLARSSLVPALSWARLACGSPSLPVDASGYRLFPRPSHASIGGFSAD